MAGEQAVRDKLGVIEDETVVELGVYPAPPSEYVNSEAADGTAEEHGVGLSGDMLAQLGLTEHWSTAQPIQYSLPRGRVLRYDIDPRIVLFEDIPEPVAVLGRVIQRGPRWLMDTRDHEPAALVVPHHDHERLVIWGAEGKIRLFTWKSRRP